MSMKNHPLETYIAQRLTEITGEKCRPTKASGASTEILDVYNSYFFVECKMTKKTENFVIKFKDLDKTYSIAKKVGGSAKKVLFAIQNKNEDRIVLISWEDLNELVDEEKFDNIFAMNYIHLVFTEKTQITMTKEDFDDYYNEVFDDNRIPVIVFHDAGMNFYAMMDLEDFFYVLKKYVIE